MKTKQAIVSIFSISAFGLVIYLIARGKKPDQSKPDSSAIYLPNWDKPFNMEFADEVKAYLSPKMVSTLAPAKADHLAKKILSLKSASRQQAEQSIQQVFSSIKSKVELSNLSKAFFNVSSGKDFYRFLESLLSKSGMQTLLMNRVNQLANYTLL